MRFFGIATVGSSTSSSTLLVALLAVGLLLPSSVHGQLARSPTIAEVPTIAPEPVTTLAPPVSTTPPGLPFCPTAPLEPVASWLREDQVVVLTMSTSVSLDEVVARIVALLCLPSPQYVQTSGVAPVATTTATAVAFEINVECHPDVCHRRERLAALVLNAPKLQWFFSVDVRETSQTDTNGATTGALVAVAVVALVFAAVLLGVVVLLVVRHRRAKRRTKPERNAAISRIGVEAGSSGSCGSSDYDTTPGDAGVVVSDEQARGARSVVVGSQTHANHYFGHPQAFVQLPTPGQAHPVTTPVCYYVASQQPPLMSASSHRSEQSVVSQGVVVRALTAAPEPQYLEATPSVVGYRQHVVATAASDPPPSTPATPGAGEPPSRTNPMAAFVDPAVATPQPAHNEPVQYPTTPGGSPPAHEATPWTEMARTQRGAARPAPAVAPAPHTRLAEAREPPPPRPAEQAPGYVSTSGDVEKTGVSI